MAIEQKSGTCRFCGQVKIMEVFAEETQEEIDEKASLECKCKYGQEYRAVVEKEEARKTAIVSAKGTTFELFNKEYPEIEEALNGVMDALTKKKIKSITIDTGAKVKAKMKYQKATIVIERVETASYKRETEVE